MCAELASLQLVLVLKLDVTQLPQNSFNLWDWLKWFHGNNRLGWSLARGWGGSTSAESVQGERDKYWVLLWLLVFLRDVNLFTSFLPHCWTRFKFGNTWLSLRTVCFYLLLFPGMTDTFGIRCCGITSVYQ